MSLLTQAIVAEKYGLRLTVEQLGECIGLARNTIYNKLAKGEFKITTYLDGGQRFCDYRDVATYLDECRARAKLDAQSPD